MMLESSWTFLGNRDVSDYRIFRLCRDRYRFEPSGEIAHSLVITAFAFMGLVAATGKHSKP